MPSPCSGWFVRVGGPFNTPVGPINNGILRLWVGQSLYTSAVVTLIVRARLAGLDESLEEAAADLGAPPARAFRQITLPIDQLGPRRRRPAVVHAVPRQHDHRQLRVDRRLVDVPGLRHRHRQEHHQTVRRCRGGGVVRRHGHGLGLRVLGVAQVGRLVVADRVDARRRLSRDRYANRRGRGRASPASPRPGSCREPGTTSR